MIRKKMNLDIRMLHELSHISINRMENFLSVRFVQNEKKINHTAI